MREDLQLISLFFLFEQEYKNNQVFWELSVEFLSKCHRLWRMVKNPACCLFFWPANATPSSVQKNIDNLQPDNETKKCSPGVLILTLPVFHWQWESAICEIQINLP